MGAKDLRGYVSSLVSDGEYCFTTSQAVVSIGKSLESVRAGIRHLRREKLIATPTRGFHVIVPLEYRSTGCPPASFFIDQMMNSLGLNYYVCLLSAAERYGASHQKPQMYQIMVEKPRRDTVCGNQRIRYIVRKDLTDMPVNRLNTPTGTVRFATLELTLLEMFGFPVQSAGLSNAATVALDLADQVDPEKLLKAASVCPASWAQRLGYVLDLSTSSASADVLNSFVQEEAESYALLRRSALPGSAEKSKRWKLILNTEMEPEQ